MWRVDSKMKLRCEPTFDGSINLFCNIGQLVGLF